ncbi:hypothetical protein CONPUDRAFT_140030 [Coniophora puteana RWD-64-598 SS2]|uniref:Uncharacterized protein n=1 Tax=Coniophora puteana (strain RWD-64-598) TaxID=741705 RepID=A0A5M3M9J0_CONPW|nr:uncharacterized protein CONPUDRAFT_140030 [Coniophora puteana RWD-64-598 SS2]EIW75606.1 hypothetical protein CONPUDRAFT_140030 [Coniophora puteana RWD-64-598 SS2]
MRHHRTTHEQVPPKALHFAGFPLVPLAACVPSLSSFPTTAATATANNSRIISALSPSSQRLSRKLEDDKVQPRVAADCALDSPAAGKLLIELQLFKLPPCI